MAASGVFLFSFSRFNFHITEVRFKLGLSYLEGCAVQLEVMKDISGGRGILALLMGAGKAPHPSPRAWPCPDPASSPGPRYESKEREAAPRSTSYEL